MLDLSSYRTISTSTSKSTLGGRRKDAGQGVVADGYVRCRGCRSVVRREFVDFRMVCERCDEEHCERCNTKLDSDGHCIRCLEVEVATDADVEARRKRGLMNAVGQQVRPGIITEEDEYNAYSGGVFEYSVNDDTIEVYREFDRENEDARDLRALTNENGWCRRCFLELSVAEQGATVCRNCEE